MNIPVYPTLHSNDVFIQDIKYRKDTYHLCVFNKYLLLVRGFDCKNKLVQISLKAIYNKLTPEAKQKIAILKLKGELE